MATILLVSAGSGFLIAPRWFAPGRRTAEEGA
jgi:hypothetical protein